MRAQTPIATISPARSAYDSLDELSEVLLAGARARAVADACEAKGLAAVLLDGAGRVLHVGAGAAGLLGAELRIEADHLIGRDAQANGAIQAALNPILGRSRHLRPSVATVLRVSPESLMIAAAAYDDGSPYQILRAIVLLGRDRGRLDRGLRALRL